MCVCVGARARSFEKTKGRVRQRNFRLESRRAKQGPSSGSLCPATLPFLVPELGSQIWSLQCLPQRARSCFCDQYWSLFLGPKCLRESYYFLLDTDIRRRQGDGNRTRHRSKGCANAYCCGCMQQPKPCYTVYIIDIYIYIIFKDRDICMYIYMCVFFLPDMWKQLGIIMSFWRGWNRECLKSPLVYTNLEKLNWRKIFSMQVGVSINGGIQKWQVYKGKSD